MFAGMRSSLPRALAAVALAAAAALTAPAGATAQTPTPFGHACSAQNGVRFCPTTDGGAGQTVNGVPSFDGVPLDVDVTLPATGNGPFPTIVMLHGWGGDKTAFESTTAAGGGTTTYHYNNVFFAQRGYAVINYTARGFGHSCGWGPTAIHTGACAGGYIHLADTRYEAHDTQYLLGLLADAGIVKPGAIGVTGISYGGGQSLELAYLKNRVRTTSGALVPWTSPKGTALSITAAYPRWEWSDLVDALLPNGRFLDTDPATNGLSRNPVGDGARDCGTGCRAGDRGGEPISPGAAQRIWHAEHRDQRKVSRASSPRHSGRNRPDAGRRAHLRRAGRPAQPYVHLPGLPVQVAHRLELPVLRGSADDARPVAR